MIDQLDKLKEERQRITSSVKTKTAGYITAGLGLVAGLAWNDAIKSLIESLFPLDKSKVSAQFIYALVITLFVVITTTYLVKSDK